MEDRVLMDDDGVVPQVFHTACNKQLEALEGKEACAINEIQD